MFTWPDNVHYHTMNPVGRDNMMAEHKSYLKWERNGETK